MYLVQRCDWRCGQPGDGRVSHNVSLDSTTHTKTHTWMSRVASRTYPQQPMLTTTWKFKPNTNFDHADPPVQFYRLPGTKGPLAMIIYTPATYYAYASYYHQLQPSP